MVIHRNYGFFISLALHLIIFMIPTSMIVSRHFKEVELFVIDERPVHQVNEKMVKFKPKEMPKENIKNMQTKPVVQTEPVTTEPVITESEIKEAPTTTIIEPVVISNSQDAVPLQPAPKSEPQQVVTAAPELPKPLLDAEFGLENGPRFLHRELPVYPLIARRLGKEGTVLLRLTIDEKGNLLNVEVLDGAGYGFTEAAVEAVKKSTFTPAIVDGKAVPSKAILPIRFSLRRN